MVLGVAAFALAVVVYAALASRLSRWSITMPMVFVGVGFLLGSEGLGWLDLSPETEGIKLLAEVTLALLLFADATTLRLGQVRLDARLPARLLLIGLPLTMLLGTGLALWVLPGENLAFAALLAAILAPTDAALGLPIFNDPHVPVRIRRALNVESGLNDGIATPFVTLALAFAAATVESGAGSWWITALVELGLGIGVGLLAGVLGSRLLDVARRRGWTSAEPMQVAVLGIAAAAYFGALTIHGNGFIAAFVGGLVFGAAGHRELAAAAELTEQAGTILSLFVWGLFGAVILPAALHLSTDARPLVYALLSLTVIRMLPVALALVGTRFRADTVLLMGWFGPRGLASVVFTLLAFTALEEAGSLDTTLVAAAVWTILLSVMAHGLSAVPLAAWYARRLAAASEGSHERAQLPELYERRTILTPSAPPER